MIDLNEMIKKIDDLPPLPDIVVKLLHASRDPNVSSRDMVELIKHDPALTIKVLRLCNSTYYSLPRKINSIQEALVYIGTDTLVNFVLAGCLSTFYQQAQEGYGLGKGELWRHSVGCAIASQRIASLESEEASGQAFTAGLIHDIGKIVLDSFVEGELDNILALVDEKDISFGEAEKELIGCNHTEAGMELAKHWNLPDSLSEAISFHQSPEQADQHGSLVSQVHLGNLICLSFGIGLGTDGLAYTFHPYALQKVGMEVSDLFKISLDIHDDYKKAEELIGLAA